jgi:N-acetylglutamate synthase-like GNAT family acetyltransferase
MTSNIRLARTTDIVAIEHLVRGAPGVFVDVGDLYAHGHLLVLDIGEPHLAGVAHLDVTAAHGRLDLLVVDPALAPEGEARLTDVARAVGEAYGCHHVDVAADHHVSVP